MLRLVRDCVPHLVGMLNGVFKKLRAYGIKHVECVLPIRFTTLGILIREIDEYIWVFFNHGPYLLDAHLVELGHVD